MPATSWWFVGVMERSLSLPHSSHLPSYIAGICFFDAEGKEEDVHGETCLVSSPAIAFSSMSIRATPDRSDSEMPDSPQYAPANYPQIAPVVSASSPRLTAFNTASLNDLELWKAHNDASRLLTTQPDLWIAGGCFRRKLPCAIS